MVTRAGAKRIHCIQRLHESHCNGCMNVARDLCRSTKPCAFLCKVAAAGNERYLVCAAGAATLVLTFSFAAL